MRRWEDNIKMKIKNKMKQEKVKYKEKQNTQQCKKTYKDKHEEKDMGRSGGGNKQSKRSEGGEQQAVEGRIKDETNLVN
jgi:hypothetical protein